MRNVIFIAYYFPPIGGGGVQRSVKFVRYLPDEGYSPVLVTGPGKGHGRWDPDDFSFFRDLPPNTRIYRVSNENTPIPSIWNQRISRWLRLDNDFDKWWIPSAIEAGKEAIKLEGAHLIYASMSPFSSARVAEALSIKFNIPWVADLRDPWALDEMMAYPTAFHRKLEERNMYSSLSTASGIVMNTPEATKALLNRFPKLGKKFISTITNGYDMEEFIDELDPRRDVKFRIVHSGYLHTDMGMDLRKKKFYYRIVGGAIHGVDILTRSHYFLVKAIKRWLEEEPSLNQEIELVFVGAVTPGDEFLIKNDRFEVDIKFTGYLPHEKCLNLVRTADLLFLPMHNLPSEKRSTIIPGKTYEYMATGKPILAAVPEGDAKDYLERSGMAYLCKPDDVIGMQNILKRAYINWKAGVEEKQPNQDFILGFERRKLTRNLAMVFDGVISGLPAIT